MFSRHTQTIFGDAFPKREGDTALPTAHGPYQQTREGRAHAKYSANGSHTGGGRTPLVAPMGPRRAGATAIPLGVTPPASPSSERPDRPLCSFVAGQTY